MKFFLAIQENTTEAFVIRLEDRGFMIGRVLWFDVKKGFGFIKSQGSPDDIFAHYSKILAPMGEFRVLEEGDIVEFELFYSDRGNGTQKAQAKDIKIVGGKRHEVHREEQVSP